MGVIATVPKIKPVLRKYPLEGKDPSREAIRGQREVYVRGKWVTATIYEMDLLKPGNEIDGPIVVEAPATTLFVPPGRKIRMDEYKAIWMEEVKNG